MKTIDPIKQAIGTRIAEARERMRWSQEDLAHKVGVSKAAVWQWEKGQTTPSSSVLPKLPGILRIRWQWLTEGTLPRDEAHSRPAAEAEPAPSPSAAKGRKLKEIGNRISRARNHKHMSPAALAEKLDVEKTTILSWEQGTAMAEMAKFDTLAGILGVTRQWLLTGQEDNDETTAQDVIEAETLKWMRKLTRKQQVENLNNIYDQAESNLAETNPQTVK
jgi:transcriptional regulator with XRE-family HTH domain